MRLLPLPRPFQYLPYLFCTGFPVHPRSSFISPGGINFITCLWILLSFADLSQWFSLNCLALNLSRLNVICWFNCTSIWLGLTPWRYSRQVSHFQWTCQPSLSIVLLSLKGTSTHQTLSRQSHCISYCSCSHQLPSPLAILFYMAHLTMSHTNSNKFKTLSPELFSSQTV